MRHARLITSFAVLAATPLAAQPRIYRNLPVELQVREQPGAVRLTDGNHHVAYLVTLTSWMDRDLELRELTILDADSDSVIARFDSTALADPLRQRSTLFASTASPSAANRLLREGRTALLSVQFTVRSLPLPRRLVHRVEFAPDSLLAMRRDDGSTSPELVMVSEPLETRQRAVIALGPPLRGGPWRCGNGLSYENAHSVPYPFRVARFRVPQRFGCDYRMVDSGGNVLPSPFPDTISNAMFYGQGQEVIAVAAGTVTYVRDGIAENVPRADGSIRTAVPLTNETNPGNSIALRVAPTTYAFYAHLQPGSIRVRVGQKVTRGQVLGLLGNSGNSVGPHLHFHVGDANSLNGSDAAPYVLTRFDFLGINKPGRIEPRRLELPGPNAIVRFP